MRVNDLMMPDVWDILFEIPHCAINERISVDLNEVVFTKKNGNVKKEVALSFMKETGRGYG